MATRIDTPLGPVMFVVCPADEVDVDVTVGPADSPSHQATLWTAAFRFTARRAVTGLEVTAGLTTTTQDVEGGASSGEHLDAVTLRNDSAVVTIGGPDEERLRFESGIEGSVHYVDDHTLAWRLPGLSTGETSELTLAVAWSGPEEDDYPATWFAVDLPFRKR